MRLASACAVVIFSTSGCCAFCFATRTLFHARPPMSASSPHASSSSAAAQPRATRQNSTSRARARRNAASSPLSRTSRAAGAGRREIKSPERKTNSPSLPDDCAAGGTVRSITAPLPPMAWSSSSRTRARASSVASGSNGWHSTLAGTADAAQCTAVSPSGEASSTVVAGFTGPPSSAANAGNTNSAPSHAAVCSAVNRRR